MYHCKLCGATNTIDDEPCWQCLQFCKVEIRKKLQKFFNTEVKKTLKRFKLDKITKFKLEFTK